MPRVTSSNVPLPRLRYRRCRARLAIAAIGQRSAVDEEHVEPAVVVVVEEQAAAAHDFVEVPVGACAVDVHEVDPARGADVHELHGGRRLRHGHAARREPDRRGSSQ